MTLQIKENAFYKRRDGKVVGPATITHQIDYPWSLGGKTYTSFGVWLEQGLPTDYDLVVEMAAGGFPLNCITPSRPLRRLHIVNAFKGASE